MEVLHQNYTRRTLKRKKEGKRTMEDFIKFGTLIVSVQERDKNHNQKDWKCTICKFYEVV